MTSVAERQEIAMGISYPALDCGGLLVGEGYVIVVAGALLNDGARGCGLHIF